MLLQTLRLENFRNYQKLELELSPKPGITIFLGNNAEGKTNLLESIALLAFPRSFRAFTPADLVTFDKNHYLIEAEFSIPESTRATKLKIGYQRRPIRRTYQIGGADVTLKEYLTNFQTVLFTPEDIEILSGAPSERRRILDTILSQVNREYFEDLLKFAKVLKQRNILLKKFRERRADSAEISYWNKELIRLSASIHAVRQSFIEYIKKHLTEIYRAISGDDTAETAIDYKFSGQSRLEQFDTYAEAFASLIESDFQSEVDAGHTLFGPHRDDFSLKLNDRSVAEFCSRGEKRSFSLVLKFIEIIYLEEITKQKPVLLLDDVFSELDSLRRHKLLELAKSYQTIITTVEKSYFADYDGDLQVHQVENGEVFG